MHPGIHVARKSAALFSMVSSRIAWSALLLLAVMKILKLSYFVSKVSLSMNIHLTLFNFMLPLLLVCGADLQLNPTKCVSFWCFQSLNGYYSRVNWSDCSCMFETLSAVPVLGDTWWGIGSFHEALKIFTGVWTKKSMFTMKYIVPPINWFCSLRAQMTYFFTLAIFLLLVSLQP